MQDDLTLPLVEGRECGSCNVCCVALTINDPQLRKAQGIRCKHNRPDNRCAIYEARPATCRDFYCGWRRLKWVRDTLRPDVSGVLIRLQIEKPAKSGPAPAAGARHNIGVVFTLLETSSLRAEGLAESVAAAVLAELPTYLGVPGPPGYTSSQARINDVLREAVLLKDKAAVLDILRQARAKGRKGERKRLVL